ncbi:MAG: hypothetical protein KVP17_004947 [Porospora cf. gigantea B]|nr:MAG: hypothetical protein KVP17_004947 [Porospora cf. gigantea B]
MTALHSDVPSQKASLNGSGDIKEITGSGTSRSVSSDAPIMEVVGVLNVRDVTGEPEAKSKLLSLGLVNRRPRKPKSSSEAAVEPQREERPKRVDSGLSRFMSQEDIDVHIDKKKMDSMKAQQPSPPPAISKALSRTLSGSPKFRRKSSNLTPSAETTQPIKRKESIKRYNSLKLRRKTTDQSEASEQPPLPKRSDSIARYNSLKLRRKPSSEGGPSPVIPEGSPVILEGSAVIPDGSAVIPDGSAVAPEPQASTPKMQQPRITSSIRIEEPARSTAQATLLPKANYRSAKASATTVLVPKSTPLSSPDLSRATSAPSEATKQTIDLWRKMGSKIETESPGEDYTVLLHMESRAEEADGTVRSTRLVVAKSPRAPTQPPSAAPVFLRTGQSPMLLRKSSASSQPPVYFLDRGSIHEEGLREQEARRDREDTSAPACSSCCLPIV